MPSLWWLPEKATEKQRTLRRRQRTPKKHLKNKSKKTTDSVNLEISMIIIRIQEKIIKNKKMMMGLAISETLRKEKTKMKNQLSHLLNQRSQKFTLSSAASRQSCCNRFATEPDTCSCKERFIAEHTLPTGRRNNSAESQAGAKATGIATNHLPTNRSRERLGTMRLGLGEGIKRQSRRALS